VFGLDDRIASLSDGASIWLVLVVAVLLGLRHATDPDHLAAVTTLVASGKERASRAAGRLGLCWGLGHATTLFVFGLPIVLANEYLPDRVQQIAESVIAVVIVVLAVRLIQRWRGGYFHVHEHEHEGERHVHLHSHASAAAHAHGHRPRQVRTPLGAYGIGLVHGMGGSAGVGVLIVASVESTTLGIVSLVLLAVFTAVSMWLVTTGFGRTLVTRPVRSAFNVVAPALGVMSLGFGIWYGMAAWDAAWYPF
jgi:high-affinity nickel permease